MTTEIEAKRKEMVDNSCKLNLSSEYYKIAYSRLEGFNLGVEMGIKQGKKEARKEFIEIISNTFPICTCFRNEVELVKCVGCKIKQSLEEKNDQI